MINYFNIVYPITYATKYTAQAFVDNDYLTTEDDLLLTTEDDIALVTEEGTAEDKYQDVDSEYIRKYPPINSDNT